MFSFHLSNRLYLILFVLTRSIVIEAVIPTSVIEIEGKKVYAAPAVFGDTLPYKTNGGYNLDLIRPLKLQDGCEPEIDSLSKSQLNFALLVQRSPNCTFGDRAKAAQDMGAIALIVENTIEGIYRNRNYTDSKYDYECNNGDSWESRPINKNNKLSGFPLSDCSLNSKCDSKRCLLTGEKNLFGQEQICCAWDSYVTMSTSIEESSQIKIPSLFIRMIDTDTISQIANNLISSSPYSTTTSSSSSSSSLIFPVTLYSRYQDWINYSSLFLWLIGTFTAGYASWYSCHQIRQQSNHHQYELIDNKNGSNGKTSSIHETNGGIDDFETPSMDLSLFHAVGFIVIASLMLVILFFFDLYLMVILLYCVSATSCCAMVLFRAPCKLCLGEHRSQLILIQAGEYLEDISLLDIVSNFCGFLLAVYWFFTRNTSPYAFIFQDIFGMCLCVLFLQVIKLPNLKVATLLLSLAFFYDIFFVFISPLFFHESVMVKVASGNEPTQDPNYCDHYPTDEGCSSNTLPMLLLLPKYNDYEGGTVMLGLGDIVLPGLLLAFGAKYDASASRMRHRYPIHWLILMFGYAIGLLLANIAVYVMDTGQPALLYLVPCTLGVLILYSKYEDSFDEMWLEGVSHGGSKRDDDDDDDDKYGDDKYNDDKHDLCDNLSDSSYQSSKNKKGAATPMSVKAQKRTTMTTNSFNNQPSNSLTVGYGGISTIHEEEGDEDEPILTIEV